MMFLSLILVVLVAKTCQLIEQHHLDAESVQVCSPLDLLPVESAQSLGVVHRCGATGNCRVIVLY